MAANSTVHRGSSAVGGGGSGGGGGGVSYETYAPKSSKQRHRLVRIAELIGGPERHMKQQQQQQQQSSSGSSSSVTTTTSEVVKKQTSNLSDALNLKMTYVVVTSTTGDDDVDVSSSKMDREDTATSDFSNTAMSLSDDGYESFSTFAPSSIGTSTQLAADGVSSSSARNVIERSRKLSREATTALKHTVDTSTLLRDNLEQVYETSLALQTKHYDLLKHSGELAQQCERLQQEEQLLSEHAKEIGLPLQHYDSIDRLASKVGILFKERNGQSIIIKGLARVNVDDMRPQFIKLLDEIDEAMEFFVLGQGSAGAQGTEYSKRSTALHEAALGLIKVAVIDRILQTTKDVQAALNLPKETIPADKLEASLIYTRFHGISKRSNSLLQMLQERFQRQIAPQTYIPLMQQCQAVYCNSRHNLLNYSVRKHVEQLQKDHGLIGMSRLASVFLMRVCSIESSLYLDFFGMPPSNLIKKKKKNRRGSMDENDTENDDDDNDDDNDEEKEEEEMGGTKQQVIVKNVPFPYLDDEPFQKMLASTVCSNLHRVVRRGVVLSTDIDLLCQVISVLRVERQTANASKSTRVLARSISAIIEDAQERLIFCTSTLLQNEVVKFHPSPSQIDYPKRLLEPPTPSKKDDSSSKTEGTTNVEGEQSGSGGGGDSLLQAQAHLYETWYPPMRSVLKVLSKIFRVVEPRVFEDIARQAVQACTASLRDAANTIRVISSQRDSDLFLVKHLLILREQLSPFDIQLRAVERQLDFSEAGKAVTKFLATRNRRIFSMSTENALVTLLREGVSIQESSVDSKRDLEEALRSACNDFINHSSHAVATPLVPELADHCHSMLVVAKGGESSKKPESSSSTSAATTPKVPTNLKELDSIHFKLQRALETFQKESPVLKNHMKLYLVSTVTQGILLKPVTRKLLRGLEDVRNFVIAASSNNNDDDEFDMKKTDIFTLIHEMEGTIKQQFGSSRAGAAAALAATGGRN